MQSSGVGALGTPLANLDAELEQFATDARRAQKRAGKVPLEGQVTDFAIRLGSSDTARSSEPVDAPLRCHSITVAHAVACNEATPGPKGG